MIFYCYYYYYYSSVSFLSPPVSSCWNGLSPLAHPRPHDSQADRTKKQTEKRWLAVFETVLLKPFPSFPCGSLESCVRLVLRWLCWLTGRRRQKPRVSWGEQRRPESAGKTLMWCSFFLKLPSPGGSVANKTRSRFLPPPPPYLPFPCIYFTFSHLNWFVWGRNRSLERKSSLRSNSFLSLTSLDTPCSAESFTVEPQSMQLRKPPTMQRGAELLSGGARARSGVFFFLSFEKHKSNLVPRYQIRN